MFPINNKTVYTVWNLTTGEQQGVLYEDIELISYIAGGWQEEDLFNIGYGKYKYWNGKKYWNKIICLCNTESYQILDNYNRIIQPLNYIDISFIYYKQGKVIFFRKFWRSHGKYIESYKIRIKQEKKIKFRYDPIPGTHKWSGGPSQRMQRVRPALLSMQDPTFKRGSKKQIPTEWDDKFKERYIKNWKHQSKCRHQWQRGKKDQWLGQ